MHDTPDAERHDAHAIVTTTDNVNDLDDTERFILEMLVRLDEADTQAEHLKRALDHSRSIGAAIGIIMAFKKMTQDEAFDWLRSASQDRNRKLYDLAQDIVATGDCDGVAAPSSGASSG